MKNSTRQETRASKCGGACGDAGTGVSVSVEYIVSPQRDAGARPVGLLEADG